MSNSIEKTSERLLSSVTVLAGKDYSGDIHTIMRTQDNVMDQLTAQVANHAESAKNQLIPLLQEIHYHDLVGLTLRHVLQCVQYFKEVFSEEKITGLSLVKVIKQMGVVRMVPELKEKYEVYFTDVKLGKPNLQYIVPIISYIKDALDTAFSKVLHSAYHLEQTISRLILDKMESSTVFADQLKQVMQDQSGKLGGGEAFSDLYVHMKSIKTIASYERDELEKLEYIEDILQRNFKVQFLAEPLLNLFRHFKEKFDLLRTEGYIDATVVFGNELENFWDDYAKNFHDTMMLKTFLQAVKVSELKRDQLLFQYKA